MPHKNACGIFREKDCTPLRALALLAHLRGEKYFLARTRRAKKKMVNLPPLRRRNSAKLSPNLFYRS